MSKHNMLHYLQPKTEENPDPVQALVNTTFMMLGSRTQLVSPAYAECQSMPVSNDKAEAALKHAMIKTAVTMPRLAEVLAIGGKPLFCDVNQSVRAYKILCNYLLAFRDAYYNEVFQIEKNDVMMANTLKLENAAEYVYRIAQPLIPEDDIVSTHSLMGRMGRGRFTRDMFMTRNRKEQPAPVDPSIVIVGSEDDVIPAHNRITDKLMEHHFENNQKRSNTLAGWG